MAGEDTREIQDSGGQDVSETESKHTLPVSPQIFHIRLQTPKRSRYFPYRRLRHLRLLLGRLYDVKLKKKI
jgi:hypothetical protein